MKTPVVLLTVVALLGIAAFAASQYLLLFTRDSVVDQAAYLGNRSNPADIYDRPSTGALYSPLSVAVDPMDRLMLVDIADDPDYIAIEMQVFDDVRGQGARVILYHKEGPADFYCTSEALADVADSDAVPTVQDLKYHFDVTGSGLDAGLKMTDREGKPVEFTVKEASRQEARKGFLAPIGGGTAITFDAFPFFHMKGMEFVPREGTEIAIKVDGHDRTPAQIAIPVNWKFVYRTRYTTDPILGFWNKAREGELPPLQPGKLLTYQDGRTRYDLVDNAGHREIRKMTGSSDKHSLSFEFSPAIPDLPDVRDGIELDGRFSLGADDVLGIVAGEYHIQRHGGTIEMQILPQEGWQPMPGTTWVKSWAWHGTIVVGKDDAVSMRAMWVRQ